MDIFNVIALLCSIQGANNPVEIDHRQAQCQRYFIQCLETKKGYMTAAALPACIKERKP
jgi:hypothetical protein